MPLCIPVNLTIPIDAHQKWLQILKETKSLIARDKDLQKKAAKGLRLKERNVPPEMVGGLYAKYCSLINRMHQAFLGSQQLQRAEYIKEIISVLMRRMFELRNELVKIIVNDYIYLDGALIQQQMIPQDIEVVVPCHLALEARKDSVEELLQTMWAESVMRRSPPIMVDVATSATYNRRVSEDTEQELVSASEKSVPIIFTEDHIQAAAIQSQERYRQFFIKAYRVKCRYRRMYFPPSAHPPPQELMEAAVRLIQMVYRKFMEIKRKRLEIHERDVVLGIVPDPWARLSHPDIKEESQKLFTIRRRINERTRQAYMKDLEQTNTRLIMMKRDVQIDDITDEIREWFKEWYHGYNFLPEFPYEIEGGTIMVVRGDYPTIVEKKREDEVLAAATKGKSKAMLKAEKAQAKKEAVEKAKADKEYQKVQAEILFKLKCNPFSDPGYEVQQSKHMQSITDVLQRYNGCWSVYDKMSPAACAEVVFGYIKPILTADLMNDLHLECRRFVDELMRLEWKLLLKAQKKDYKRLGLEFPKERLQPRPRPPMPKPPMPALELDEQLLHRFEYLFDMDIISKPTAKIDDILGDSNYAAYDKNVADPHSCFPLPGYGDIRNRLVLSCVFGSGLEPKAVRNKSVLLVGQARNGKSFLVDCVAGEMNAVKIDITPEVFSSKVDNPGVALADVFLAARAFQPCVVYMRNVERVFTKKVPPEEQYLKAGKMKAALTKCVKGIQPEERVIFIATCSTTTGYKAKPMIALFNETILVPRADYASVQMFLYNKLQSIRSMPRDYCVHALAHVLQGYGFGIIIETYNRIMTPERTVRMHLTPLDPLEFVAAVEDYEQLTIKEYQDYQDFCVNYSSLRLPRAQLVEINERRAVVYEKTKRAKEKKEAFEAQQKKKKK